MGEIKSPGGMQFCFEFLPEPEFDALMPEQFFVRAMHSNSGVFLADEFLAQVQGMDADELVDHLINDLNRECKESTNPVLLHYYLFTDFKDEFSRLVMMKRKREQVSTKHN